MNSRRIHQAAQTLSAKRVGATTYEIEISYRRGALVATATAYVDAERTNIFIRTNYGATTAGVHQTIRLTPNAWLTAAQVVGAVYEFLRAAKEPVDSLFHTIREVVNYEGEFAAVAA